MNAKAKAITDTMNKALVALGFVVLGALVFSSSAQAVPLVPTIYAGAGASWVGVDDDSNGFQYDDDAVGWKGFGGIQNEIGLPGLSVVIGLEGQYHDLGEIDFTAGAVSGDISGETWGLSAHAGVELIETITLFAKAGAHFWDVEGRGTDGVNTVFVSDDGTDFFFGLGGEASIGPFLGLRAEWERYTLDGDDIDVGTVSLLVKFF